nr:dirigent protein 22-like [Ipomoea batatas]
MATSLENPILLVISILLLSLSFPATGEDHIFGKPVDRKSLGLKKEKASHFRFFWHDILSGNNPTSIRVIQPPNKNSSFLFGLTNMIDNPLTIGPELGSKCVGRAQGMYASAAQEELGFLMVMNLAFVEGKYNGSTLTVVGRNPAMEKVREMSVVGGSGLFRFARGYVQAKTHWIDFNTGDATVHLKACSVVPREIYNLYGASMHHAQIVVRLWFGVGQPAEYRVLGGKSSGSSISTYQWERRQFNLNKVQDTKGGADRPTSDAASRTR